MVASHSTRRFVERRSRRALVPSQASATYWRASVVYLGVDESRRGKEFTVLQAPCEGSGVAEIPQAGSSECLRDTLRGSALRSQLSPR